MAVGSGVGVAVGSSVGVAVGSSVGVAVGSGVGVAVGSGVGVAVGSGVGVAVGSGVGVAVGSGVGVAVGSGVDVGVDVDTASEVGVVVRMGSSSHAGRDAAATKHSRPIHASLWAVRSRLIATREMHIETISPIHTPS